MKRQGFPHALRSGQQSPESALTALISAIAHKHERLSDETEEMYQRRLRAIAVKLINSAGYVLVRSDGDVNTND